MEAPTDLDQLASGLPGDGWSTMVDWPFDEFELLRIRAGFTPSAMEDKWRILSREEAGTLSVYFRRSWTNDLVFVAEIKDGRASRLSHAKGCFAPELTVRAILDGYLLGRTCVLTAPRALGTDKSGLMSYGISVAGRRCDFVEPEAARTWFVSMDDPQIRWVHNNPNAVDRQFPRLVTDESMSSRFRVTHTTLVRAAAAMLRPDRAEAVANGVIPTDDAGLDHDELARLRGWLDDLAFMDEGQLRRAAAGLSAERSTRAPESAEDVPASFFAKVPAARWLLWGRGRPSNARLAAATRDRVRAHVLEEVRREDPRFALARGGWAVALMATGDELLEMVRGDDVVRAWTCTGRSRDSRDEEDDAPSSGTSYYWDTGRTSAWEAARSGTKAPAQRCYWVVESALLAGAYPESPSVEERGNRVEELWRSGIRTFVSLVEENERGPKGDALAPYVPAVAALRAAWGERAKCVRFPIRDVSVTTPDAMRTILDIIDLSLEANRPVYVHCLGGVGRTGTVIGCWLRRHGLANRDDVLAILADLRRAHVERSNRTSPETPAQREMVRDWKE